MEDFVCTGHSDCCSDKLDRGLQVEIPNYIRIELSINTSEIGKRIEQSDVNMNILPSALLARETVTAMMNAKGISFVARTIVIT